MYPAKFVQLNNVRRFHDTMFDIDPRRFERPFLSVSFRYTARFQRRWWPASGLAASHPPLSVRADD
jgi:hypothetical protein